MADEKDPRKNDLGGVDPSGKDMEKAKESDLITLPSQVEGTNCFNCKFVEGINRGSGIGQCTHPKVQQAVTKRMCCKWWDHTDVKRPWSK